MNDPRKTARWLVSAGVAVLLFVGGVLYGRSYQASEERRLIGVWTGHNHTITFRRDHHFSLTTTYQHLHGTWRKRVESGGGFWMDYDSGDTGVAALTHGSFAGERGDLAVRVGDYWVVTQRSVIRSLFLLSRVSPNQAMERTATRDAFTSRVAQISLLRSTLALGGRRSSYSR